MTGRKDESFKNKQLWLSGVVDMPSKRLCEGIGSSATVVGCGTVVTRSGNVLVAKNQSADGMAMLHASRGCLCKRDSVGGCDGAICKELVELGCSW